MGMNYFKINIEKGQRLTEALKIEDRTDREIECLSILYDKPTLYFETMPKNDLIAWVAKTDWLGTFPEPKQARPFAHGNYIYRFKTQANQLSKAEFTILQELTKVDTIQNLHKILALLSVKTRIFPQKDIPQTPDEFEARSKLFGQKMSFGLAYSYAVFFSTYWPQFSAITLSYFQGMERAAKEILSSNGQELPTD